MILLDTHVLIWMASDPKRLSRNAREAIRREREHHELERNKDAREKTGVAISGITLWELAWLAGNGRIQVTGSVESFVRETASRSWLSLLLRRLRLLLSNCRRAFRKTQRTG